MGWTRKDGCYENFCIIYFRTSKFVCSNSYHELKDRNSTATYPSPLPSLGSRPTVNK